MSGKKRFSLGSWPKKMFQNFDNDLEKSYYFDGILVISNVGAHLFHQRFFKCDKDKHNKKNFQKKAIKKSYEKSW